MHDFIFTALLIDYHLCHSPPPAQNREKSEQGGGEGGGGTQKGKVCFQSKVGASILRGEGLYLFGLVDGSQNFTGSTRRRRCHRDCETKDFYTVPSREAC
jgi:hypothetical protein